MKTQYEYLAHLLYEYFYRQQIYRENDLVQLTNNISFRHADPLVVVAIKLFRAG